MKKFVQVTLGILTAIGGFVDMGDLVANAATGARFGMNLAWVVLVGVVGIVVYAENRGPRGGHLSTAGVRVGPTSGSVPESVRPISSLTRAQKTATSTAATPSAGGFARTPAHRPR